MSDPALTKCGQIKCFSRTYFIVDKYVILKKYKLRNACTTQCYSKTRNCLHLSCWWYDHWGVGLSNSTYTRYTAEVAIKLLEIAEVPSLGTLWWSTLLYWHYVTTYIPYNRPVERSCAWGQPANTRTIAWQYVQYEQCVYIYIACVPECLRGRFTNFADLLHCLFCFLAPASKKAFSDDASSAVSLHCVHSFPNRHLASNRA